MSNPRRALLATGVLLGLLPASASAASLSVSVQPKQLRTGDRYVLKVAGSYSSSELVVGSSTAFLVVQLQYTSQPCASTADVEQQREILVLISQDEPKQSFSEAVRLQAKGVGVRRVCAYLYGEEVTPSDSETPLQRATAVYRASRPPRRKR